MKKIIDTLAECTVAMQSGRIGVCLRKLLEAVNLIFWRVVRLTRYDECKSKQIDLLTHKVQHLEQHVAAVTASAIASAAIASNTRQELDILEVQFDGLIYKVDKMRRGKTT